MKKKIIPALLAASLLAAAPTAAVHAETDVETQIQVITDMAFIWENADDMPVPESYYCISDIDQDGNLEVRSFKTTGSGVYTSLKIYGYNPQINHITEVARSLQDGEGAATSFPAEDLPDSVMNLSAEDTFSKENRTFKGYYDAENNNYIYFACNTWRGDIESSGRQVYSVHMEGMYHLRYELIGESETTGAPDSEVTVWKIGDTTYDSEEAWYAAMNERYAGMAAFTYTAPILCSADVTDLYTDLLDLAQRSTLSMDE
ncbi:MAG: hypothetical protein Q4B09_10220 [Lachnospiraceae bacterium]|nr:hypothetical protein [Lachnospiraceae bacterium]